MDDLKYMRKCPICGKAFYCPCIDLWVYKEGHRNKRTGRMNHHKIKAFCSWHCFREWEKKHPKKRPFNKVAMEDRYGEV